MHISIGRIGDRLAWLEEQLIKIGLGIMTCMVAIQVASRNIGYYIPWLGDVAVLAFTWIAFIGAPLAIHKKSDFIIDIWGDKWVNVNRCLYVLTVIGTGTFIMFLFWQGMEWTWEMRGRISGAGEISLVYYALSVPVGSILIAFHLLETTIGWVHKLKEKA